MFRHWLGRCALGLLTALGTMPLTYVGMAGEPGTDSGHEVLAAPLPFSNGGGSFELVTYNVAGLPEGISRSHPLANLAQIGERLNRYDIALVQEDFAYPLELRRGARHPHATAPFVRSALDFGDGLSQFARLPFSEFRREAWQSCHGVVDSFFDCLTPKGFSRSRQSLGPDASAHVYNLHMDAGWSAEDRAARAGQVAQLIEAIRRDSAGQALIVGGDTNILGRERALLEHLMTEAGLEDACAETRCPEPWRIDRVLYRSSARLRLRPRRWRIASEFVDAARRPLSDHLAVAVQFEWRRGVGP
jgi:endonuclease/exonuclease/phosphatase family metal-dependent hydrolase